jgi:hypothetical protein
MFIHFKIFKYYTYCYILLFLTGEDFQEMYGLNKPNIYDPSVNPSTSQEFSSAAYRILHATIPVQFKYVIQ